jgi:hypothetical protein
VLTGDCDQILPMCLASSSDKALVKLAKLVHSAMISRVRRTTCANTLPRLVDYHFTNENELTGAKGNCKFGPKCANIHVLPNGQRVNYHKGAPLSIGNGLNIGGRVNPGPPYHSQSSALTNSLYSANMVPPSPYGQPYSPFQSQDENFSPLGRRQSMDAGVPTIDTSYASHPTSAYGSPRDEDSINRLREGLHVLDAPLPASFDSNGISHIARYGQLAASVPSKFGLDSPTPSLGFAREGRTSEALKNLHSSAFGDDTRDRFNGVVGSPPAPLGEEYFGKRPMHSLSQRYAKTKIMSASLPKAGIAIDSEWDADFTFDDETDYLPNNLQDLLTPQEKARRGSRTAEEEGRPTHSGAVTPGDSSSKFGSPSNASPSRWGTLFSRQQREEEEKASRTSAFGHVGSPLRNSSLHLGSSPSTRPITRPAPSSSGDASPYFASPPRQSSMSMIAQELQRTRLSAAGGESGLHQISRNNNSSVRRADIDRQVSSSSIGTGRFTTPIDEEQADFVFSMEEEEDKEREREKRNSGGWSYPVGGRSPHLGAMGGRTNGNSNGAGTNSNGGIDGLLGVTSR